MDVPEGANGWVDFNDATRDGSVDALRAHFRPSTDLAVGATVLVGDFEGNRCRAKVHAHNGAVVTLLLDRDSFKAVR